MKILIPIEFNISSNLLKVFLFINIFSDCLMIQCDDRNKPYLINNNYCEAYCPANVNEEKCVIQNEIIKTQYLNNIIFIEGLGYAFVNVATSKNNNLYLLSSGYPESNLRNLYLLNNQGYGLLDKNNPMKIIDVDSSYEVGRFESEIFTFKLYESNDDKEYLISISKAAQYVEIYDFDNNVTYFDFVKKVFGNLENVFTFVGPHLKLKSVEKENKNTYLIGILACEYINGNEIPYFYLKKVNFTSLNIKDHPPSYDTQKINTSKSKIVSCYETSKYFIICFFQDPNYKYIMVVYNYNLQKKTELIIANGNIDNESYNYFFECIHFFDETGVFAYFTNDDNHNLVFEFKRYFNNNNTIIDHFKSFIQFKIDNYYFNNERLNSCDMIKVEDKKFYFVGVSLNKKILYIISLFNYNEESFSYRVYSINLEDLYNYRFSECLRLTIYNNFLAAGLSHYNTSNWSSYPSLIIFNYIKSENETFDLISYIYYNDIKINNLELELEGKYLIENNIFGYVYSGIEIIENCLELENIYLADLNDEKIISNYFLSKNDKVKLIIPKKDIYETFTCKFQYASVLSEPEFSEYNKYPIEYIDTGKTDKEDEFFENNKKKYIGRYSYYEIFSNYKLTEISCGENCELCYSINLDNCITCKYSFSYDDYNIKICDNKSLETEASEILDNTEITGNTEIIDKSTENDIETNENLDDTDKSSNDNLDDTDKSTNENLDDTDKSSNEDLDDTDKSTNENLDDTDKSNNEDLDDTDKSSNENLDDTDKSTNENLDDTDKSTNENLDDTDKSSDTNIIENNKSQESDKSNYEEKVNGINSDLNSITEVCNFTEIIDNKCNGEITNNQVNQVYSHLKSNLKNNNSTKIKTNNAIFQVSAVEDQKNSDDKDVSNIDLGECETILKNKNNISIYDDLIIFKIDMKDIEQSSTYVQYEIYNPYTFDQLDLDVCKDININIYAPVYLDDESLSLFSSLDKSGYNLFNSNDSFYNDFCTPYTTMNGTDVTLKDRQNQIYSKFGNKQLCQNDCELLYFNQTTQKAKCNCAVQTNSTDLDILSTLKLGRSKIEESFLNTLSNANFQVLKCYKLAIDLSTLFENIGRIIMTIILFIILILFILYWILGNKKLQKYLADILNQKVYYGEKANKYNVNINNHTKLKHSIHKSRNSVKVIIDKRRSKSFHKKRLNKSIQILNDINKQNKIPLSEHNKNDIINKHKEGKNVMNIFNINNNIKKESSKDKNHINNRSSNLLKIHSKFERLDEKNKTYKKEEKSHFPAAPKKDIGRKSKMKNSTISSIDKGGTNQNIIVSNNIFIKMNKKKRNRLSSDLDIKNSRDSFLSWKIRNKKSLKKSESIEKLEKNTKKNRKNLTNQELNTLDYKEALIYDKRTYTQYYWSLLKKKQLFLFTIISNDDYNLVTIKFSLFLMSFSLYFTLNGFFFSDSTMHKIYDNNGTYDIILQIPKIFYSTLITTVINMILKNLSLSERNMLELKQENSLKNAQEKSRQIWSCIKLKALIFFILSILLMAFFWYFISCFCAVYKNTQNILITDTLISFGLSMVYPFGINLIPGIFRIYALRSSKKDKECLYKISMYVSLI